MSNQITMSKVNNKCPECNGDIRETLNYYVCSDCGLILDIVFQKSSFSFNEKVDEDRGSKQYVDFGDNVHFPGSLGSFIGYEGYKILKDGNYKKLTSKESQLYKRLKTRYNSYLRFGGNKSAYEYSRASILHKIINFLNCNKNVYKNANYLYQKIIRNEEEKIPNKVSLLAFSIYIAIKNEEYNAPISIKNLIETFQRFGHRMNHRMIIRNILRYKKYISFGLKTQKSETFISKFIHQVIHYPTLEKIMKEKGVLYSKETYKSYLMSISIKILNALNHIQRGNKNPSNLAASVIYLADKILSKEKNQKKILTQKIISDMTEISEYSLRDCYVHFLKPIFLKYIKGGKKD